MNSATHSVRRRQRHKTGLMTRIVLLVSFIILLGRLILVIPGAISHHQQKQQNAASPAISTVTPLNPRE